MFGGKKDAKSDFLKSAKIERQQRQDTKKKEIAIVKIQVVFFIQPLFIMTDFFWMIYFKFLTLNLVFPDSQIFHAQFGILYQISHPYLILTIICFFVLGQQISNSFSWKLLLFVFWRLLWECFWKEEDFAEISGNHFCWLFMETLIFCNLEILVQEYTLFCLNSFNHLNIFSSRSNFDSCLNDKSNLLITGMLLLQMLQSFEKSF